MKQKYKSRSNKYVILENMTMFGCVNYFIKTLT